MNFKLRILASLLAALALARAGDPDFKPGLEGKRLIEYGWDAPNTAYLREHVREMEKRPFQGVVLRVTRTTEPRLGGTEETLGWRVFGRERFQPADYEHAIEDLRATPFRAFTDNFVQVISMPGLDWFDPEWSAVAFNAGVLARVAKQGGCVGLMFDPEQYGGLEFWSYGALPEARRKQVSLEQAASKVRERGGEFMRAVNGEFPNIKILCLFGPAMTPGNAAYDLLAPFYEGMCRAAAEGTEIIDGYEQAYAFSKEADFQEGRKRMGKTRDLFEDKGCFDRVMRAGFGLWLDHNSGRRGGWFPGQPEKNQFTPETWRSAVHYGLSQSDRYVWIYSERLNWWDGSVVGPDYEDAQRDARRERGGDRH